MIGNETDLVPIDLKCYLCNDSYAYDFSISVTFSNPGVYYYICEYPGHAAMGMYGTIEVM